MTRQQILSSIKLYFKAKELVCDHVYKKFGESSWNFLDTDYLHALLVVRRDILKRPMVANYGTYFQRGLRCNMCSYVKNKNAVYLSAHVLGKAGDFTVEGMTAQQARDLIKKNAFLLPVPVRLEKGVSWLHMDVRSDDLRPDQKVIEFSA